MSIRTLTDIETGETTLYCSTSMWAFGPVFMGLSDAEDFLAFWKREHGKVSYLPTSVLYRMHLQWLARREETRRLVNSELLDDDEESDDSYDYEPKSDYDAPSAEERLWSQYDAKYGPNGSHS